MYYNIVEKEDFEYINEYLLSKKYILHQLNDDKLERIYHYETERLFVLITQNIYSMPNNRKYYFWFENEDDLNEFFRRFKNTTIKKYTQNYFNLYKDFENQFNNFKKGKPFNEFDKKNILEQQSLTFTYYSLQKFIGIFKNKYERLEQYDISIFNKYEKVENEIVPITFKSPLHLIDKHQTKP